MSGKSGLEGLMGVTMDKIREMVDVQTIIGEPMKITDDITVIPVSKVSYGFASGGSDLPAKENPKELFGGGAGAGVTVSPVAFLVVQDGEVRMMRMDGGGDKLGDALRSLPEMIEKIGDMVRGRQKKGESKADDVKDNASAGNPRS